MNCSPRVLRGILAACCFVLHVGCHPGVPAKPAVAEIAPPCVEDSGPETFLENCQHLRASDAFRQNVCLCFKQDGHGAICMDLNHQLYLVVVTKLPARPVAQISERFRQLQISTAALRKRMDPDAFILNRPGEDRIRGIFRIPDDVEESFAAELFNDLLGLKLEPGDIWFQWD